MRLAGAARYLYWLAPTVLLLLLQLYYHQTLILVVDIESPENNPYNSTLVHNPTLLPLLLPNIPQQPHDTIRVKNASIKHAYSSATLDGIVVYVCDTCSKATVKETKMGCIKYIAPLLLESNNATWQMLEYAQEAVAIQFPDECNVCHPTICLGGTVDREVGFDAAAPKQLWGVVPALKSLPGQYRIPPHAMLNNNTLYKYVNDLPDDKYILHAYNPSLVPVPSNIVADLPNAHYLASFRLSTLQTCAPQTYQSSAKVKKHMNFLGLAVLDDQLQIIRDLIVDVNEHFGSTHFEDFRLQILKGTTYVVHGRNLLPIEVSTRSKGRGHISNIFGDDGLYVKSLTDDVIQIRRVAPNFKNTHIFESADSKLYLEFWPEGPRKVKEVFFRGDVDVVAGNQIDSSELPRPSFASHASLLGYTPYAMSRPRGSACCLKVLRSDYADLLPAAGQNENLLSSEYILVGISHSKSGKYGTGANGQYLYLSRIYAFLPTKPFSLVARSGFFCLGDGIMADYDASQVADPHMIFQIEPSNRLSLESPYLAYRFDAEKLRKVKHYHYDACPRVHFISGMVESTTNSSQVVLSYGINDCVPRFAVVEKRSILERLFLPMVTGKQGIKLV